MLEIVARRSRHYDDVVGPAANAIFARKTVLLVEDDEDLRTLYRAWITGAGFDVLETDDGIDALQIIDSSPPDLIILDIRLPTLDGLSVREEIAADARTRDIPVIVVTGSQVDVKRLTGTRVLHKPVNRDRFLTAIRAAIK